MNCPVCNVSLLISERQGIEIDYCPQCRGVWLDRGELDKIIDRSAALTSGPAHLQNEGYASGPYYDKHHNKHHDGHYRKKSFLHELFD